MPRTIIGIRQNKDIERKLTFQHLDILSIFYLNRDTDVTIDMIERAYYGRRIGDGTGRNNCRITQSVYHLVKNGFNL